MSQNLPGVSKSHKKPEDQLPRKPGVVIQPQTYRQLMSGVNLIADAIRPTLGPLPRLVALEKLSRTESPEILDDGATIARRIIAVRPRGCDVGAMLLRGALWKMHLEVGDGTTTMGVLYQAILREGIRAVIQRGCNAMLLRNGLEKGLSFILDELKRSIIPLEGSQAISQIALGMCQGDREMADSLGEIFDIVGPEGMIVVEKWNRLGLETEYVEGTYWELSGWFSRLFVEDARETLETFEEPAILISDLRLTEPGQVVPVLEACIRAGIKRLVIIAAEVSDRVIGLLVKNNEAKTIRCMSVRTPRITEQDRAAVMEDVAILTGGKPFYSAGGNGLEHFQAADLGQARRAWASESQFGIFGGKGDPRKIRQHIAQVQELARNADHKEEFANTELQKRVGRLLGGTAILRVGAVTDTEVEARKEAANRAVTGLRHAVRGGVVPGGGAALFRARAALESRLAARDIPDDSIASDVIASDVIASDVSANGEEGAALKILARALEEPLRVIAANAGYGPDVIVDRVNSAPIGYGLDALRGKIVDMGEAGIFDSAVVLAKALEIAVSGAALALTTDVLIHHAEPVETVEP